MCLHTVTIPSRWEWLVRGVQRLWEMQAGFVKIEVSSRRNTIWTKLKTSMLAQETASFKWQEIEQYECSLRSVVHKLKVTWR